jgi:hypothetical protein
MLLLIGPAVAVIGLVAVVFVMRHKSVEKRSMYSARRSQIEHKVRAARQRTLTPTKKAGRTEVVEGADAGAQALTYEPPAYAGPPVAPPAGKRTEAPAQPAWDSGPTAQAPSAPSFNPPAPAYEPAAPAYEPAAPAYEPPPSPPPQTPQQDSAWTPAPPMGEPERPSPAPATPASTSAGAGASWSVVGETKGMAEPEPATKKRSKQDAQTGAWSLASGEMAGEEGDEEPRARSGIIAVAQYAVLVVGLVMVLIGVVVMVANSSGS